MKALENISRLEKPSPVPAQAAQRPAPSSTQNIFDVGGISQAAGNLAMQSLLRSGVIRAKLSLSQPGDPDEQEADQIAERVVSPTPTPALQNKCACAEGATCSTCADRETIHLKEKPGNRTEIPSTAASPMTPLVGGGEPLPPSARTFFEPRFGRDLSQVRIHTDAPAHQAADALNAEAFAHGSSIFFARGRFDPSSRAGQHLIAHELAHTLQRSRTPDSAVIQRNGATLPATEGANTAGTTIAAAVRNNEVGATVSPLRDRSLPERASIRTLVNSREHVWLEHWLAGRMSRASTARTAVNVLSFVLPVVGPLIPMITSRHGASTTEGTAEEGLRLLWPIVPLIDRLEVYDEGYREIEQAQLDVIRSASRQQRDEASHETTRMNAIYAAMNPKEEYDARILIDSSPAASYAAAVQLLIRAPGVFSDAEEAVFDAILALEPAQRRSFFNDQYMRIDSLLWNWQITILRTMTQGSEAQALIARLRLATESRSDDMAAVQHVVDRAVELLRERRELRVSLAAATLPAAERTTIEARLRELEDLDTLLQFQRGADGALAGQTFMGLVSAARGEAEGFGADAQRLTEFAADPAAARRYAFEVAKQRILLAGSDVEGIRATLITLHAPPVQAAVGASRESRESSQQAEDQRLRQELLADPAVAAVVGGLTDFNQRLASSAVRADAFDEVAHQLNLALNSARYGEFFRLTLRIARNDEWRARYQATAGDPFDTYARVHGEPRRIMETILRTQHMPFADVLAYTSDVELLRGAFEEIPETDRARLRLGWSLMRDRPVGPLSPDQQAAIDAYQALEGQVRSSQTTVHVLDAAGFEAVLHAILGSEPTIGELATDEGRYRAAALMYDHQEARLALGRGASAYFTETDETMAAAGREFAALWLTLRPQHRLSMIDFSALSALNQRFESRSDEFREASNAIGEMAGMVAATVAGIVVVVATGGAATPGVIAVAAASGAGTRVVTRQMFGGQYYNALSNDAARDALLGAVDAALAVVSGTLAARGAQLMGLSGHALTSNAARLAGQVVEEATQPFARRIAASAVESALDGAFSGAVSQGFGAFTDERTWRRGIMDGLARAGQSALIGGLAGLGGGAVLGGALPVVGGGARWLRNAVVGQSLENTLARAGASETLAAARRAASSGSVEEANRLAAELEAHLAPEEAAALRQQLYSDLRHTLGHPPGTAAASSESQARLLAESGGFDVPPRSEHLDAEIDIVQRSQPQPSRELGFVDEVDLGNGHTWRRNEEGRWCRFSDPTLCGTPMPHPPPMSPAAVARARIAVAEHQIERVAETIGHERQLVRDYNAVVDNIVARVRAGERYSFNALTEHEKEVIEQALAHRPGASENLTLADLQAARRPRSETLRGGGVREHPPEVERGLRALYEEQERAIANLRDSTRSVYDKLRSSSPTARLRDRVIGRARGLDQVSGAAPPSGALDVDHIVPLREMVDLPGFRELDWSHQVELANFEPNLKGVDSSANRSRGDSRWADTTWSARRGYSAEALRDIIAEENRLRAQLQAEINRRLGRPGVR